MPLNSFPEQGLTPPELAASQSMQAEQQIQTPQTPRSSSFSLKKILIILVVLVLFAIPIGLFAWLKITNKPVSIPFLNKTLSSDLLVGSGSGLNGNGKIAGPLDVSQLVDPMNADSFDNCFMGYGYSCLLAKEATISGQFTVGLDRKSIFNGPFTLGLLVGDNKSAVINHYREQLIQNRDNQPTTLAVTSMLIWGKKTNINPYFLWAYYSFLYDQADKAGVTPSAWGLADNDQTFAPDVQKVAQTLGASRQLFPEGETTAFGDTTGASDDVIKQLNQTGMSQEGKAVVYATIQLFGNQVAQQVFRDAGVVSQYYDGIFRNNLLVGTYTFTFAPNALSANEFYSPSYSRQGNFAICHAGAAMLCSFEVVPESGDPSNRQVSCRPASFLQLYCQDTPQLESL